MSDPKPVENDATAIPEGAPPEVERDLRESKKPAENDADVKPEPPDPPELADV